MRKTIIAILLLAIGLVAQAQIRMPNDPKAPRYHDYSEKTSGFWCAVEGGMGTTIETGHRNMQIANATFTAGYRLSEWIRAGVGIGTGYYVANTDLRGSAKKVNIPIFANARGNIISQYSRGSVPYWSLSVGGKVEDGFFVRPTIGCRIGEERGAFLVSLSYEYSDIKYAPSRYNGCSLLHVSIGYEF